jgi:hypothetical protein
VFFIVNKGHPEEDVVLIVQAGLSNTSDSTNTEK